MGIQDVIEAAEWLGETGDTVKLTRLKELLDNQKFYVTVWGHYSAGKSALINNIVSKDILPVQTRETTAALTYIQYGTKEECVIVYENGTSAIYDLSVLKDIFQNTTKFEEVGDIDHLEVYLNNDLLSTGLVLVDTPGVNTVIQKHQDLAVDAIEQSGRIIYVLGNSPSNVDRQFIKQISDCGVQISFVRTKCDKFQTAEENPAESLENEKKTIEEFIGDKIDFIPVSNEAGNSWSKNVSDVKAMIRNMADSISDEMSRNIDSRLSVFIKKYTQKLAEENKRLEDVKSGNVEKMDAEILNCEKDLKVIESILNDIEKKIEQRVSNAKKQSQKEMDNLITTRIEDFADAISQIEPSTVASTEVKAIYEAHISESVGRMQRLLNGYFEEIIQEEADNIISNISDKTINLPVPTYAEVQQENSRILEMYNSRLLELKQAIEKTKEEQVLNEDALNVARTGFDENDYDEALALLEQKLTEIPSGMALRLADKQDVQPSSIFKAFGNVVDIALLLVPGDVVVKGVKGVANTTKIAQALHKMGKAGEVIVKAGNAVGKNANAIDKVRDIAYALNQVLGKRKYSTQAEKAAAKKLVDKAAHKGQEAFESFKESKKTGNVLDALSVAYWTEKLGKKFDSEPKMEVDREEEERRNQMRKQISSQQQQLMDERINRKKELGLLQDKASELKLREQEDKIKIQRIEEEIKKQEQNIVQRARISALNKYKREYKDFYGGCITDIASDMMTQYFMVASQNITMYIASQSRDAMDAMKTKKTQLEEVISLKDKNADEITAKIEKCQEIKNKLESVS
ncbi:dynamin family protein [Butyrivibrio sp. LC3010]|uniref:dynamin family protein n=1 Tax=Butyrivibrio sp. LC3010 TaxID=1280680 RepID=UPI00041E31E0|nr:dynamin family protein [Butyrivibrio sp. LC3010]